MLSTALRWTAAGGLLALAGGAAAAWHFSAPVPPAPQLATVAAPVTTPVSAQASAPSAVATGAAFTDKRLHRTDKDHDGRVSADEFLASRRKSFEKLDANGDGRLSFEEYAHKSIARFGVADADRNGILSAAEYETTAVKRAAKPKCDPPVEAGGPETL